MQQQVGNRRQALGDRIDSVLRPLFDWFTALPAADAAVFRSEIIATVLLRPVPLVVSSLAVLMMSGTAMAVTGAHWAMAWFGIDAVVLGARLVPVMRHQKRGGSLPDHRARIFVCIAFLMLLLFSLGCAGSVLAARKSLAIVATASMMGVVAALATRWAALPRLALPAIVLFVAPFCAALAIVDHGGSKAGAAEFAIIVASVAALTLQNRTALIALLRAERRNRLLAVTDALTNMPNRGGLITELDRLRADAGPGAEIASLFIDLDEFKAINDRFGHAVGDRVLIAVARRLEAAVYPHFVCRLGGDEFVVVMTGVDRSTATFVARRIVEQLERPITGDLFEPIVARASVGIAFGPINGRDAAHLLSDADVALYLAKQAGGGRHAVGEPVRISS